MMEKLSVKIAARTKDALSDLTQFKGALSSVGNEALGTAADASAAGDRLDEVGDEAGASAAKLYLMSDAADEAGDEMTTLSLKSGVATGALSSFTVSTEGASLGVTTLSSSISAALLPAVGALSTALAPIAAVLGTAAAGAASLAGAFGLVVGSGAIAGFNRLKETLQESLGLIEAQLTGFGQSFVPVLDNILSQLPALVSDILGSVGDVSVFADALQTGFQTVRDLAPQVTAALGQLARDALPVLKDGITFLVNNGPSIFREMVSTTRDLAPQIMRFTDALIEATPAILEMGTFVFSTVVPALTQLTKTLTPAIRLVGSLSDEARTMNRVFSGLPSVIQGILSPFKVALIPILAAAKAAVGALGLEWATVMTTVKTQTVNATETIQATISTAIQTVRQFIGELTSLLDTADRVTRGGLGIPNLSAAAPVPPAAQRPAVPSASSRSEPMTVEVTGRLREENGEIVGVIEDTADQRIDTRETTRRRRATRSR